MTEIISQSLLFLVISAVLGFVLANPLIATLKALGITRRGEYDDTTVIEGRVGKIGTPVMGGALVILVVAVITMLFNWDRRFTWVPIGVLLLSATLGGVDDLLNIFGQLRRIRTVKQIKRLSQVHKYWYMRLWFKFQIPWIRMKRFFLFIGSRPGKGVQVHEKLFFQFVAGVITAWWLFVKLGPEWERFWIPFVGELAIGWLLVPLIILVVMATANAVNLADGLDGLAGGTLITSFGGLMIVSWLQGNIFFAILNATVIGALLAYTYFNVKPALFEMGDIGSLGLGALMAVMLIAQNRIFLLPFFGFIFFVELGSVVLQLIWRYFFGKRLFKMSPLHHHLEINGWIEERIVQRFWILNAIAVFIGIWLSVH